MSFHDSAAAGYAEVWNRPDVDRAFYLSLNSVVGGAFIIGKHSFYEGSNGRAAEIGHVIVQKKGGKKCYCGQHGCLDTLLNTSVLDFYTDGNLELFFEKLQEGDGKASDLWDEYLDTLAVAIHNLRMLFDCPIIIGGYVGAYISDHMEALYRKIDRMSVFSIPAASYVFPCQFRREATAAGAALQIIDKYIDQL